VKKGRRKERQWKKVRENNFRGRIKRGEERDKEKLIRDLECKERN